MFPLLCESELATQAHIGRDGQRSRLPRAWADLRRCMPSTLLGIEWETIG